jgi:hypothetical protein
VNLERKEATRVSVRANDYCKAPASRSIRPTPPYRGRWIPTATRSGNCLTQARPGQGRGCAIAKADGEEFRNQYPAYASNPASETRLALEALHTDPMHLRRYDDFVSAMVYGKKVEFAAALRAVVVFAEQMIQYEGNGMR